MAFFVEYDGENGFSGAICEYDYEVSYISYFSMLLNGQPTSRFSSSRGLIEGDPLSPFLFILGAEGLSALLRDAEQKKKSIHGVKIGKKVEPISHLFYADDSLLFVRWSYNRGS